MDILAATAPTQPMPGQPSPYQAAPNQQMPAYQMQDGRPVQRPSPMAKIIGNTLFVFYIAVIVFFVVMTYRFVRATEKIADSVKGGLPRKEDAPT